MRRIIALVVVLIMCWGVYRRAQAPAALVNTPASGPTAAHSSPASRTDGTPNAVAKGVDVDPPASAPTSAKHSAKAFQNRARLDEHFAKHGAEFPGLNEAQYLAMAQ